LVDNSERVFVHPPEYRRQFSEANMGVPATSGWFEARVGVEEDDCLRQPLILHVGEVVLPLLVGSPKVLLVISVRVELDA
jgi:hypothetical protein